MSDKAWSVFFTITRPGISTDGRNALLKVTANCASGPRTTQAYFFLKNQSIFGM